MNSRTLLLSIRPKYAELFFSGRKKAELRRIKPRIKEGDLVLIYVTSPVKALMGAFNVKQVLQGKPKELWREVNVSAGISRKEFDSYYLGAPQGFAILSSQVWRLKRPIKLASLKHRWARFSPPQSYLYVTLRNKKRFMCTPV